MDNPSANYQIVKGVASNEELQGYRHCFAQNGSQKSLESLQWLHQQNLTGLNSIYYAMHSNTVAAIYTAMPVVFKVNQSMANALQSIDTITDAAHRGKGLFPKLAKQLYSDAPSSHYKLVYGFPNENSAPGFFNKLGWVSFGEAPFLLKPLSFSYFLNKFLKRKVAAAATDEHHAYDMPTEHRLGSNTYIKRLQNFENDYDVLWAKVAGHIPVTVNRGAAYMNWRYVHKPGETYATYGYYASGILQGIVTFTIKNKHNGRIGYLMELVYNHQEHAAAGIKLLQFATSIFKREKTDAVLAWCFDHSFNYAAYKKAGYFSLPVRFRPQHLFLGVRAFDEQHKSLIENMKNWYISYSDSDTV